MTIVLVSQALSGMRHYIDKDNILFIIAGNRTKVYLTRDLDLMRPARI